MVRKVIRIGTQQGLEIGEKACPRLFSIILDPALNRKVHMIPYFRRQRKRDSRRELKNDPKYKENLKA